ncbi:variable surface lipoprotein [Mycoplasmopsis bovis]|uniref:variable surface lipoprotein n=1 Tax=Mycoplasmopsis bovis TaxID=28903 RepID=UPI00193397BE|nr:variable surface lipoprotein [Mycoplasmopsis bovis]QRF86296.1 variable surface lipoprotein [Mycoplasmopsis bovis]
MKSINKLLISAVSAISLAMPLVAASCGVTKPSEQGSESKPSDTNKPSEQGSGSKPSEIDPIQNDTTNNQPPKIPNTVGDLFKELRKIRDQYYRFKEKLDSLDDKEKLMIKLHFDYWFEKPDPNPDPDLNIDQDPDKLIKESGYDQIKKILEKSNKDSKEYIEAVNQLKGFIEIYNADLRPILEKITK